MQISSQNFKIFLLWIFPIISYQFFQFTGFNKEIVVFTSVFFYAFIILYTCDYVFLKFYKNNLIKTYQYFIFWIFFCTLLSPLLIWGQNIFLNFRISIDIYRYIYLFLLLKTAISERKLVTLIDTYFIINLLLKILFLKFSLVGVFGFEGDFGDSDLRGILRPRFEGTEFATIAFFMHISIYKISKNWKDLFFIFFALAAIFLDLSRQYIFFSVVLGVILFVKTSKYKIIYISLLALFLYFLPNLLTNTKIPVIKDLLELSQNQIDSNNNNEKDIRLVETEYFLKDFNNSLTQVIIGNGLPHAYSEYGKKTINLSSNYELYTNDVGYVHIYIYSGLIGVFLFFLLYFKLIRTPIQKKYIWAKFYIFYIILSNMASQTMSMSGITLSIAIYFIFILNKTNNVLIIKNKF